MKLGIFSLWTDARKHELVYGDLSGLDAASAMHATMDAKLHATIDARTAPGAAMDAGMMDARTMAASTERPRRASQRPLLELTPTPLPPRVAAIGGEARVPPAASERRTLPPAASERRTLPPAGPASARPPSQKGRRAARAEAVKSDIVMADLVKAELAEAAAPPSSKRSKRPAKPRRRPSVSVELG